MLHPAARGPRPSPVVDDLPLTAAVAVVVQDDVAVTTVELPVCGGVHRHFGGAFDSPDLREQSRAQHGFNTDSTPCDNPALPTPAQKPPRGSTMGQASYR